MSFPISAPPSEPQIRGHFYWALKGTLSLGFNTQGLLGSEGAERLACLTIPGDVVIGQPRTAGLRLQQAAADRLQGNHPLPGGVGLLHGSRQRRTRMASIRRRSAALQHIPLSHDRVDQDVAAVAQFFLRSRLT